MAVRWSNPSGSAGFDRFKVWPAGTDSYSHSDLAANFDTADAIIGNSPDTNWPPTTGLNGGIYREVTLLQANQLQPGMIFPFFRPTLSVPIPAFAHVCDGSTLDASQHDFPGGGSITLPDLVNAFWIGADVNKTIGEAGANPTDGSINSDAGAPGPQGVGGQNSHVLTSSESVITQVSLEDDAMINTSQSWPFIAPVYQLFVKALQTESQAAAAHENRPRFVGLIPLCVVKLVNSL